jgi:hypothetical protein
MSTTIVSGINTSGQSRLHIGDHNEHHEHRHYADESQLSPTERQRAREDAILSSLYFTEMSARERAIDSPCKDTFGWIFDERVTERETDTYHKRGIFNLMSRWLKHEHGMFFIVGKAGSGKSTLMRFLAEHEETSTLLQSWAGQQDCALGVFAHYFWCSGSQSQSSQEGLWRSVLYAIAKEHRGLASAVFADRAGNEIQTLAHLRSQRWARDELSNALSLLVAQLEVQKVAVCLFIDGLDEYQGDEMVLIEELRQLLGSPYIKICASSRPRNLFEEAFGSKDYQWKLALHLLTQGDMIQLASTRLYEDDAFCKLVDRGDIRQDFVTAITDKSQGVFLWTVLVVREMIREAHQAGTIDELKECLDALPVELGGEKGLYQRIFERSDPRYRKYMARLLLVMLEAGYKGINWEGVHFLYDHARDAAFATRECLGLDDKYRLAWDEKAEEGAILSWIMVGGTSCRGLFLACHRSSAHPRGVNCRVHRDSLAEDALRRVRKWCPDFVDTSKKTYRPEFLHRSVGEYLSVPKIRRQMIDLASVEFDPVLTRCYLELAHSRLQSGGSDMGNSEQNFLELIASVGHERRESARAILPEFEHIQDTKWRLILAEEDDEESNIRDRFWAKSPSYSRLGDLVLHGGLDISHSSQAHAWFLSLVAREGLVWYCCERWSQVPTSDRQATGTIIIADLLLSRLGEISPRERADLMRSLLRSGVNPNTKYTWIKDKHLGDGAHQLKLSLWEAYVEDFPHVWACKGEKDVAQALEMIQLLLHDGHANKKCCLPAGNKSLLSALTFKPNRTPGMERMLNRQNYRWSMFAGKLHEILDAHELLTPEERRVAEEQGWISTKLKASHSPQTTLTQSASEPNTRRLSRWLRKFKR